MPADPSPAAPDPAWLSGETTRLLDGARASRAEQGGFWWLDADGRPSTDRPRALWITTRMAHCFGLGALLGRDGDVALIDHGLAALTGPFRDVEHGGWFDALKPDGSPTDGPKGAYGHAFVLLAASTGTMIGRPGAEDLLAESIQVIERWFWDDRAGAMVEEWNRDWSVLDRYRGANANMHSVEAFLAAGDATGDPVWAERALRIADRLIDQGARNRQWRVPEHFGPDWELLPEYNADQPEHPFRPYGVTPGHGLEWSRLMLDLELGLTAAGRPVPGWLREAAVGLFDRALTDGWDDVRGGFPYTTGWDGVPVVAERFHWVVCEAIGAAWALHQVTGEDRYAEHWARFWEYARATFLDGRPGWLHEATVDGVPSTRTWTGRPDVYHALQASLISRYPLAPSFAKALAKT
jgi:mannose/cellobiose epimerase-like protein (N-acyl-D-glucosamine 2-epimerase family)